MIELFDLISFWIGFIAGYILALICFWIYLKFPSKIDLLMDANYSIINSLKGGAK